MEILLIFALTLLNGFFALSEIALISAKRSRIEYLSEQGNTRAKIILSLLDKPENFLSSVQVGITLIGIISGAYGGATLTDDLNRILMQLSFLGNYSHSISLFIVIGSITYFTIVIGELVPKTIAINNAEKIALFCAPIIHFFTKATYPFVKLLTISTRILIKSLQINESSASHISEEELKLILYNAEKQGVLETDESQIHQNLFFFTDQTAKTLMTKNSEIDWINVQLPLADTLQYILKSVHSKFIVCDGQITEIKGVISSKDFLENYQNKDFTLDSIISAPLVVIENTPTLNILNLFKRKKEHIAIVTDEQSNIAGIITLHDLIEAIVGELPNEEESDVQNITERSDSSYLVNGKTLIFEINTFFKGEIIEEKSPLYTTISGFLLDNIKKIPQVGDSFESGEYYYEVVDLDGFRIDKILIRKKTKIT
jgi:putative hemolysin